MSNVLRGGIIVTQTDPESPYHGYQADVHIEHGHIQAILEPGASVPNTAEYDVTGQWLLPGFVQAHTHLVQTLFRGAADDLSLMDWLRERIWPYEAAHDEESAYWSARLGLTEMLLGGTTAILDMASVRHTDSIFRAASECGIHAHIGKAMMDRPNEAGLSESTKTALESSHALRDRWHGNGRLKYAYAPRFVPSCTKELLTETVKAARESKCLIHSHASENLDELALVRDLTGMENVEYLASIGMVGSDVVLAHCIHLNEHEMRILVDSQTAIAHCPGSNLKLGSGIAPIPELLNAGAVVTLGADGSPCNNRLDIFAEMRLAALIQKPRLGPESLPAQSVMDMATIQGARVLEAGNGDLIVGSAADIVAVDGDMAHAWGGMPGAGNIVYACTPQNVRHVWISGDQVVENGSLTCWDWQETLRGCRLAFSRILKRANA